MYGSISIKKMDAVNPVSKPREGGLPFRVWQMYKQMISSLAQGKVDEFLVAGGTMAHYVGDACQPLHISYLHHGADPSEYGVHSDYETTLIDRKASELFDGVDSINTTVTVNELIGPEGRGAARHVLRLMKATVDLLPPEEILDVWRNASGHGKYDRMWEALGEKTIQNIARGSHAMAVLWESAWKHGGGDQIPEGKLKAIPESKLQSLYNDQSFVPSFRLSNPAGYKSVL
jgi:hypothetical protein